MNLTDRDKQIIKEHIDRDEPLPAKYKLMLFSDSPEVKKLGTDTYFEYVEISIMSG